MSCAAARPRRASLWLAALLAATLGAAEPVPAPPADNAELARLFTEDQADRQPGSATDLASLCQRDEARRQRALALYAADQLVTGADYLHAAMLFQHGGTTESYLLAHEFCLAALALGEPRARWLAAATHDRLLKSLGRPQRFGTQYSRAGNGPMQHYPTEEGVRDSLRAVLRVPALEKAKARTAEVSARTRSLARSDRPKLALLRFKPEDAARIGAELIDPAAGDTAPEILSASPLPAYPDVLRPDRIEGSAIVSLLIAADGSPTQVGVGHASHKEFGEAAVTAVRQWKFKPATKAGRPVPCAVGVEVPFLLEENATTAALPSSGKPQ